MRKVMTLLILTLLIGSLAASSSIQAAPQTPAAPRACAGGVVALTFDDGPTPETNAVLDELKLYGLKGTFFLIGLNVEAYPDIAKRIVSEGHHVGNHTWDHPPDLGILTEVELDDQLEATNEIIQRVTGIRPRFARPPYGNTNATVQKAMAKHGLREVIWTQDSYDWAEATPDSILNQLTLVPPGGTFVMHDRKPNTLTAISWIDWYFNTYWAASPICAGRLEATTNAQPVLDWPGLFFFARAVR